MALWAYASEAKSQRRETSQNGTAREVSLAGFEKTPLFLCRAGMVQSP